MGAPGHADTWFFRGLAIHYLDPEEAIESYRKAIAQRGRAHGFYAQAVLHLARARNQQLYATRSLEPFSEAEASLRQLVEHDSYGAYPYYLLSIAHRLAAEIYSGSSGTRGDSLVEEHYAQALDWARRGQEVEPDNDRPITAEAECLESMGRLEEALEARSRALAVARKDRARWEDHHYRWRLHYWLGHYEEALEDLTACAGYDPRSRLYAHFYPALVRADMGDRQVALTHARALAEDANDALSVLWSATSLRLLGHVEEADTLLESGLRQVDYATGLVPPQDEEWVCALYDFARSGEDLAALEAQAQTAAAPWKLWGEAYFHAGALRLAAGDRDEALAAFQRAYRSFDGEKRYTYHAKLLWQRMRLNSAWPTWRGTGQTDVQPFPEVKEPVGLTYPGEREDR